MDKLKSMQVFADVVQRGSLAKSAAHFSITSTMVGKHIKALESYLGIKLLNRTTRKQSLTEAGEVYFRECQRILAEISEAENSLQAITNSPRGLIRINSPVTYGNLVLAPIVAKFLQQYPDINIELTLDNQRIDPLDEHVDLIVRIGELENSTLIAKPIDHYPMLFCASPQYLTRHGTPQSINSLIDHDCLGFSYGDIQPSLALGINTPAFSRQHSRLSSNSGQALKEAAMQGAGIIYQPAILVKTAIYEGTLVEVLQHERPAPRPVQLLYKGRQQPLKTRTFIDFLVSSLK
ncbi:LysR family transcriptional regulator [Photobacterium sanctipauli]|uniref:LysR family transcriptional regulator n=1 Tax=Photobacterium sanctipauli TaxID=1342794 RepID=A0A2T3NP24_9GAMM|nr:LysR substrate-binding domain-containing protein [Photobacterium sanctipauli]PSW17998.1 LysR family transcriptional regulator [Photobacterium sanctipauli]